MAIWWSLIAELSAKELMLSKLCYWIRLFESPLDSKEIRPVNPKGDQSWIFTGRTDAETEAPILWPPDAKNWVIGKDPDPGKDWEQEEKGTAEDEMAGWHHPLDGHEFEQALGVVMHREAWCAAVHGVTKTRTRLSDWTELMWSINQSYYANNTLNLGILAKIRVIL